MNAHWNYQVGNVHAYGQTILRGWEPGNHACSEDASACRNALRLMCGIEVAE